MKPTAINMSNDLQEFINKFEPSKFKLMTKGIEIRGIKDLHRAITEAKALIKKMELNLVVVHNAEMLSSQAFEVNNITAA